MTVPDNRLPALRHSGGGDLKPLPENLESEVRDFVLQLRSIFEMLHISISQYAILHYLDKNVIFRYLNGSRIPDRLFLDDLLRELAPATEDVRAHLYDLHLRALDARDTQAYQIQLVTNQLADAAVELKQTTNHIRNLEQTLDAREQEIHALTAQIAEIEQAWAAERSRSEEERERYREHRAELYSQHEELSTKIVDLQAQLQWAESRREAAEARCNVLEQALETSNNSRLAESEYGDEGSRPPAIWSNVPLRNASFTGRERILEQLDRAGMKPTRRYSRHVLIGMPGVGKTQIAAEYANRFRSNYDLVCWIPADQTPAIRGNLAILCDRLNLTPGPGEGLDGAVRLILDCLRRGDPYTRWLLIFDNATAPEDINEYFIDGPGDILITSRNQSWNGIADTIPVDVFDRHESLEFLQNALPESSDAPIVDQLAEALGNLPLALDQAATLISQSNISPANYIDLLEERAAELLAEARPWSYPYTFTVACRLTFSELAEKNPPSLLLLRCLAFLGSRPVPLAMFSIAAKSPTVELPGIFTSQIVFSAAMRSLLRHSIVQINWQTRTVQIHPLIRALVLDRLDASDRDYVNQSVQFIVSAWSAKSAEALPSDIAKHE